MGNAMQSNKIVTATRLHINDSASRRWTTDTPIYNALSAAQRNFVVMVLGISGADKSFTALTDLIKSKRISVGASGYALSGLQCSMARGGFVSADTILAGQLRFIIPIPSGEISRRNNRYTRGSDWSPRLYIEGNVLYVYVNSGSYPIQVTFRYVGVPNDITSAVSPAINVLYHDCIALMATHLLLLGLGEFEQASVLDTKIQPLIMAAGRGGSMKSSSKLI